MGCSGPIPLLIISLIDEFSIQISGTKEWRCENIGTFVTAIGLFTDIGYSYNKQFDLEGNKNEIKDKSFAIGCGLFFRYYIPFDKLAILSEASFLYQKDFHKHKVFSHFHDLIKQLRGFLNFSSYS